MRDDRCYGVRSRHEDPIEGIIVEAIELVAKLLVDLAEEHQPRGRDSVVRRGGRNRHSIYSAPIRDDPRRLSEFVPGAPVRREGRTQGGMASPAGLMGPETAYSSRPVQVYVIVAVCRVSGPSRASRATSGSSGCRGRGDRLVPGHVQVVDEAIRKLHSVRAGLAGAHLARVAPRGRSQTASLRTRIIRSSYLITWVGAGRTRVRRRSPPRIPAGPFSLATPRASSHADFSRRHFVVAAQFTTTSFVSKRIAPVAPTAGTLRPSHQRHWDAPFAGSGCHPSAPWRWFW